MREVKFEVEFTNSGLFHEWCNNYDEFENGEGNYTIGIVELDNGTIEEVLAKNIKFIDLKTDNEKN